MVTSVLEQRPVPGEHGTIPRSWVLRWDTLQEERPRVLYLSEDGVKPTTLSQAEAGSFVVFDGYLFDTADLPGGSAASEASLIASAYARWGEDLFSRLRGGFVLAIWDP